MREKVKDCLAVFLYPNDAENSKFLMKLSLENHDF